MSQAIIQYEACAPGAKCVGEVKSDDCVPLGHDEHVLAVAEDLCPASLRRSLGVVASLTSAGPDIQIGWQLTEIGLAESDTGLSRVAFECAKSALYNVAHNAAMPMAERLRAMHALRYLPVFEDRRMQGVPSRETIHELYKDQGQILAEVITAIPWICSSRGEETRQTRGVVAEVATGALITRKAGPANMVFAASTREDYGTKSSHYNHDYYRIVSPGVKAAIQVKFSLAEYQDKPDSPMENVTTIYLGEVCQTAVRGDQHWHGKVKIVIDLLIKESSGQKLTADERHILDRATNVINNKIKARSLIPSQRAA